MSVFEMGCNIGVNLYALAKYTALLLSKVGYAAKLYPVTEEAYGKILTLPLWVGMVKKRYGEGCVGCDCQHSFEYKHTNAQQPTNHDYSK